MSKEIDNNLLLKRIEFSVQNAIEEFSKEIFDRHVKEAEKEIEKRKYEFLAGIGLRFSKYFNMYTSNTEIKFSITMPDTSVET